MYRLIAAVVLNFIISSIWWFSDLLLNIEKKLDYKYGFFIEIIPLIIISLLFSFWGKKNIKSGVIDFAKIFILSYFVVFVFGVVQATYSLGKFD